MGKFRIILFSLLGSLLVVMALSITGVLPNRFFKWHKGQQVSENQEEKAFFTDDGPTVDHIINNFYFPQYDEEGNEKFILKGKRAMLINDKVYKLEKPEICLKKGFSSVAQPGGSDPAAPAEPPGTEPYDSTEGAESPRDIVITARMGELDKRTNEGLLTKGVEVELGGGTVLRTDHLRYSPKENRAKTDRPVSLKGDKMEIRGEGLEAELSTGRIWVERDVIAELGGVRGNLMFTSFGGSQSMTETKAQGAKTVIQCSGKLVYEKGASMLTFHDKVRVRQGVSTLRTDKLILVFDAKGQKTKLLIAEGDVLASDGVRAAKGRSLIWDAITDATTLEDTPSAEFFEEKFNLIAPKVIFSQGGQKSEAPNGGQLNTKGTQKAKGVAKAGKDAPKTDMDWGLVNITWRGKMTFQKDLQQATFEKDVQLVRKDYTIYAQKMVMHFEGEEAKIKTMEASGGVYIVERSKGLLREANGQEGYWDFEKDVSELKGKGDLYLETEPGQPREEGVKINWDQKMMVQDNKKKITFHENVRTVKGPQKVDSNQLNTFLGENGKLERAVALGDVFFVDNREGGIESIGDTMEWDYQSNNVVVTGEPTAEVRKKNERTFAKRIYYDLKTQEVVWKERPHFEIPVAGKDVIGPILSKPMLSR
ncbi:MAG: LPS export ABC transporter periplasmic protein LptC [Planctomycetes bacterium RIFCSPHIGHO2_12_FULL_52_36]|nr:MAG: LPS export ABC transporter periplasmic protein LptC [Planctomycetes bacterium RIFCSPHIGHO2_02_FULL_52_58]OHB94391.1 MAG: LPS export ABC transporter periplasmic protein LptC [Planctomycetes bacterium RIFCSPHIGHO2_12_FULL_52_36]